MIDIRWGKQGNDLTIDPETQMLYCGGVAKSINEVNIKKESSIFEIVLFDYYFGIYRVDTEVKE